MRLGPRWQELTARCVCVCALAPAAKLPRDQLLSLLQSAGEPMSAEELTAALAALTDAPAPEKAMPAQVSAVQFSADVLGFDAAEVEA